MIFRYFLGLAPLMTIRQGPFLFTKQHFFDFFGCSFIFLADATGHKFSSISFTIIFANLQLKFLDTIPFCILICRINLFFRLGIVNGGIIATGTTAWMYGEMMCIFKGIIFNKFMWILR
jgi:hypothetical protein